MEWEWTVFSITKVNYKVLFSYLIQQLSTLLRSHARLGSEICRAALSIYGDGNVPIWQPLSTCSYKTLEIWLI